MPQSHMIDGGRAFSLGLRLTEQPLSRISLVIVVEQQRRHGELCAGS